MRTHGAPLKDLAKQDGMTQYKNMTVRFSDVTSERDAMMVNVMNSKNILQTIPYGSEGNEKKNAVSRFYKRSSYKTKKKEI